LSYLTQPNIAEQNRWVKKAKSYDQEIGVHIKSLCDNGKIRLENNAKKCPRIKAKEKTLTLGQFVGARMGGGLPQYVVT